MSSIILKKQSTPSPTNSSSAHNGHIGRSHMKQNQMWWGQILINCACMFFRFVHKYAVVKVAFSVLKNAMYIAGFHDVGIFVISYCRL